MNKWNELNSIESWMLQTEEQQNRTAEMVLERLPSRLFLAESFPTKLNDGRSLSLPCFYDEKYEMPFILIPGEPLSYGVSPEEEKSIRKLCTAEEWKMIHPLLADSMPNTEIYVPPFLMGRYPLFDSIIEENIEISKSVERPDFSNDEGPLPIYLTKNEAFQFLAKTEYRLPHDWEWELVAKEAKNNILISGNKIPSEKLLKDICITSFGNSNKNKKASNVYGISGLALATLTSINDQNNKVAVRGGAAGFYPFQGPGQWALLLTALRMPLENMPGGVAGLRLCLDIPHI